MSASVAVAVIASAGVGMLDNLVEDVRHGGATAVLATMICHFGIFIIGDAKRHIAAPSCPRCGSMAKQKLSD